MKRIRLLMGMPITIEIVDHGSQKIFDEVFSYFSYIDETFSTYKETSEISLINRGQRNAAQYSADMREVLMLSEKTKRETYGYFDIQRNGMLDPSGLVKGWAVNNAAGFLQEQDVRNFYIEAGGDIQAQGYNRTGKPWRVGIRNPFNQAEIIKVLEISNQGVATSGTYARGQHIYNPKQMHEPLADIVSLTVVSPNVYEADRFATAAFAMGSKGITFIENLPDSEAYMVDNNGIATFTSGFSRYIAQ